MGFRSFVDCGNASDRHGSWLLWEVVGEVRKLTRGGRKIDVKADWEAYRVRAMNLTARQGSKTSGTVARGAAVPDS